MARHGRCFIGAILLLIAPLYILAQQTAPQTSNSTTQDPDGTSRTPKEQEEEQRSIGLPGNIAWKFNFDAAWGTFGFGNSLYTNVRPDPSGNLNDN